MTPDEQKAAASEEPKRTFRVTASETVYYYVNVDAISPDDAREQVLSGRIVLPNASDWENFDVNDVEEII